MFGNVFAGAVAVVATAATIDPNWATPLNTFLLLLTAIVGLMVKKRVDRVEAKTDRNHETTANAATAAAAAASAAADAARITKELGGVARSVDPARAMTPEEGGA